MANKFILDTHTLIWYLEGNPSLGRQAKATMGAADSEMVLPLIAVAILTKDKTITDTGVLPIIW